MRHLHGQVDVYDDDVDVWYRCATYEQALAFCEETGGKDHGVPTELTPARVVSGFNTPVTVGTTPYKLVSNDPARLQVIINYLGNGVLLIGPKEAVLSGQGYGIQGGQNVTVTSRAELWVNLVGVGSGVAYALSEATAQ